MPFSMKVEVWGIFKQDRSLPQPSDRLSPEEREQQNDVEWFRLLLVVNGPTPEAVPLGSQRSRTFWGRGACVHARFEDPYAVDQIECFQSSH